MSIVAKIKQVQTTNLFLVDTACVIPMRLLGRSYNRAYLFRNATKQLLADRISLNYPTLSFDTQSLHCQIPEIHNFDLTVLSDEDVLAIIILDPALNEVKPVTKSYKGGLQSANSRWENFKRLGLRSYSSLRNQST